MRGRVLEVARVVLEARTPLTIGTGGGTDLEDSICVADANGLPAIPGSSLAGALRRAWCGERGEEAAEGLFGYQQGEEGAPSRLEVAWGIAHDRRGRPVTFPAEIAGDDVLALLALGVRRDHVRIGARGSAEDRGKFDESLVPRGARFTTELLIVDPEEGEMDALLRILGAPWFHLGGRTRRGYGRLRLHALHARRFDLSRPVDRGDWTRLPRSLSVPAPPGVLPARDRPGAAGQDRHVSAEVRLVAQDYWVFGRGEPVREAHHRDQVALEILPVTERRIRWDARDQGSVSEPLDLVPGSGWKGALRHRTAFHLRCAAGEWATPERTARVGPHPRESLLFGTASGSRDEDDRPGWIFVDDVLLESDAARKDGALSHVSLDRFSGGPIDGALFDEAPLYGGGITLRLDVDLAGLRASAGEDPVGLAAAGRALDSALRDLCEGRLALGGASGRGHGYFRGTHSWSDGGAWFGGRLQP